MEIWKDIEGYEGYYQVSTYGRIKSLSRVLPCKGGYRTTKEFIMKEINRPNYKVINLKKENRIVPTLIHRLVAIAFIPNPLNKPQVNHINGIKTDNNVQNLEWCTARENMLHSFTIGRTSRGIKHSQHKLKDEQVIKIRELLAARKQTQQQIGEMFGVSRSNILSIHLKKSWTHL